MTISTLILLEYTKRLILQQYGAVMQSSLSGGTMTHRIVSIGSVRMSGENHGAKMVISRSMRDSVVSTHLPRLANPILPLPEMILDL